MLQQTRAEAVAPRYEAFLTRFPTVEALAAADEEAVLKAWEGMGYYSRARNLRRAAMEVVRRGGFPQSAKEWQTLPGVGAYTAAAVASIAFHEAAPALDGNQARVLSRLLAFEGTVDTPQRLRAPAEALIDRERPGDYNQALMDLGSGMCTPRAPKCDICPVAAFCAARAGGDAESYPRLPPPIARREVEVTVVLAYLRRARAGAQAAVQGLAGGAVGVSQLFRGDTGGHAARGAGDGGTGVLAARVHAPCLEHARPARGGGDAAGGHARRGRGRAQGAALPHRAARLSPDRRNWASWKGDEKTTARRRVRRLRFESVYGLCVDMMYMMIPGMTIAAPITIHMTGLMRKAFLPTFGQSVCLANTWCDRAVIRRPSGGRRRIFR